MKRDRAGLHHDGLTSPLPCHQAKKASAQGSTLPKVVNLHLDIDIQPVDTFDEAWDPPLTLANQGDVALTVSNHSSSASIEMCAGAFTQASRRVGAGGAPDDEDQALNTYATAPASLRVDVGRALGTPMLTRPHVHCRRDRQAPSPSPSSLVPPMREMTVRDSPEHRAGLPFRPNSSPEDSLWHPDPAHGMAYGSLDDRSGFGSQLELAGSTCSAGSEPIRATPRAAGPGPRDCVLSPRSTNAFFSARPPRGTPQKCPERSPLNVEFETPGASDRSFFLRRSPWSAGSLRDGLASVRRGGGRGARSRVHVDTAGAWGRQDGGGEVPTGITPPRSPARTPVCSDDDEDAREKSLLDHLRRNGCVAACPVTPELEKNAVGQLVCGEPADCAVGPTRLFRPKRQEGQKMLFLIRHGESEFNKACKDPSNHVDEPLIWDPDLTDRGRDQCLDLREQLKRDPDFNDVGLWVVSPLTRALQTFLVGCPCVPRAASRPVLRTWPQGTNTAEALASAWRDAPMQSASAPATGTVTPPRPRRVPASQERASRDAAQPSIDAFFSPAGRAPSPHSGATPAMAAVAISRQRDTEAVSPPASAGAPCSPPPTGAPREAWGNGTGGESVAPGEGGMRCAARSLDVTFGSSYRERVKAVVHPAVAERLMCSGDVGRPRRVIEELFGDVMPVGSFDALPEEWWYNPHQGANCAVSQCMDRNEPEASLKQRIEAFKTYAMDRPERVIAVVAHSIFIKALLKSLSADGAVTLKNAEYRKIYL